MPVGLTGCPGSCPARRCSCRTRAPLPSWLNFHTLLVRGRCCDFRVQHAAVSFKAQHPPTFRNVNAVGDCPGSFVQGAR